MGFWSRLRGSREEEPACTELAPGLSVSLAVHRIEGRTCWIFVTRGLAAAGQKELVVCHPGRPQAERFFALFRTVHAFAAQGRVVDEGGTTEFGPPGMTAEPRVHGVVYLRAQRIEGVEVPQPALVVLPLLEGEGDAIRSFGAARFANRLGHLYRHYPFPISWNAAREKLMGGEKTILDNVLRLSVSGVHATYEDGRAVLRVSGSRRKLLADRLDSPGAGVPRALLLDPHDQADGAMVWQPGQTAPAAIMPPGGGHRLAACFLLLIAQQKQDGGRLFEDGVAMFLTTASWDALRAALHEERPLTIEGQGGFACELQFV